MESLQYGGQVLAKGQEDGSGSVALLERTQVRKEGVLSVERERGTAHGITAHVCGLAPENWSRGNERFPEYNRVRVRSI